MSNFAIEGLISGFDTTALIDAILDVQLRGPINQIERDIEEETTKFSAFQTLNANMLGLDVAAQGIASPQLFQKREATSSNSAIVNASASSGAAESSFTLQVDNLAKAQQASSDVFLDPNEELNLSGQFFLNGRTIDVSTSDTLNTLAQQMNAVSGITAQVVSIAPNQNKLILSSSDTGVDKLDVRNIGTDDILGQLGILDTTTTTDYSVNVDNVGALGGLFDAVDTFDLTGRSISVTDAGGQNTLDVTFSGVLTLSQIADEINAASTLQGTNISAEIVDEAGQERLRINSATGIPSNFSDQDNVLFELGVVTGIQSAAFNSSVTSVGDLLDLDTTGTSTFRITNGDSSDFRDVTIDFATDSLQDIADKINAAAAPPPPGSDISASVITNNGVSRLEITSASGNPIFSDDADNVLQTLGIIDSDFKNYDQAGENAEFRYNGISVNRTSNVVADLVDGVTLALQQESSELVTVNIRNDVSGVADQVESLVTSFNQVNSFINEVTAFNPSVENGDLFGNDTVRRLSNDLARSISTQVAILPSVQVSELNEGSGIDLGSVQITDRKGNTSTVNLGAVQTVQDVLDAINSDETVEVRARINAAGTSIDLEDISGGFGQFTVEDIGGGTTAADLGIDGNSFSNRIAGGVIATPGFSSLDLLGIELNVDGSLTFNDAQLQQALNDTPELVENLLTARDGIGFGGQFRSMTNSYTAFNEGFLDQATNSITDRIDQYNKQIERIEDRAAQREATLRKQFSSLEVALSESQNLSQFVAQQLGGSGG